MLSTARIIWKVAVSPKREENILSGSTLANSDAVTAQQMESLPEKKYCCMSLAMSMAVWAKPWLLGHSDVPLALETYSKLYLLGAWLCCGYFSF